MASTPDTGEKPDLSTFEELESEVRSYARAFPVVFARGEGSWLYDTDGRPYLDFLSGAGALNYGHGDEPLARALVDYIRAGGIAHSLDMHTDAKAAFLEELRSTILEPRGLAYVTQFTGPTGANAVEAALKLARKVTGRSGVVAFTNGFHGVTLGALAATANGTLRGVAGVTLAGAMRAAYDGYFGPDVDTAEQLDRLLSDPSSGFDRPAAVLVETVQGEGGLNAASFEWLRRIAEIAREHGALLVVDDVQAGAGRTGTFFSFERAGLEPDMVTLSKSISGFGLPMAMVLIRPELDQWQPGEHIGTFRGNCHAFVTARAALETYWRDDAFARSIDAKAGVIGERLARIVTKHGPHRASPKGRGMMQGLDVKSGAVAAGVGRRAFERGLIVETSGPHDEVVKVFPPLTIEDDELARGLDILEESIEHALTQGTLGAAS